MSERNADQKAFWNGPVGERWAQRQADMDRNLTDATAATLKCAAAKAGERVLDIGCGAGQTSVMLAEAVGSHGHVTGVDISAPLLGVARARTKDARNVDFVEADASEHAFAPDYDLVFSRFGVMFFDDPPAAFANIREALKPGGRLVFVCWRPPAENQWVALPAAVAKNLLPPQPPSDPLAPGPFAFADPKRVEDILTKAGFRAVAFEKLDGHMNLGHDPDNAATQMTQIGPLSRALTDAGDDALREKVRVAVRDAFAKIATADGIAPGIACWVVSARA
jgi:SAM-dependent methyltransferase